MKKLIYLMLLCSMFTGLNGLVVTKEHYGFNHGSQRRYKQGAWSSTGTDLSEGVGKSWNFALPTVGYVNNSYYHVSGISGFPTANISCQYTQYINGINDSGTLYYYDNGEDILNLGYTAYPNIAWNPPIPNGLPHYLNKTWQGTHSYPYGSYSVSCKVISEGSITIPLGTFPALCIRYYYSTSNYSYYYYQWETAEYGIVAYSMTVNGGMLYVLEQAEPNVTDVDDDLLTAIPGFRAYPNPVRDYLWVKWDSPNSDAWQFDLYDLRGRKVRDLGKHSVVAVGKELRLDLTGNMLGNGVYILKATKGKQVHHSRIVIAR